MEDLEFDKVVEEINNDLYENEKKSLERDYDYTLFGIELYNLYDCELSKAYDLVSKNTNYLKDIPLDDVKKINFSIYKDIIILLKDGTLFFNGKKKLENINTTLFVSGTSVFAVSYDKSITCVTGKWESAIFMNNNNYKYKKILHVPLALVTLSYDNEIRIYGASPNFAIDYKRLFDVEDIGYVEENDDIVVIKDGKVYSLFLEHDYSNAVPEVMMNGNLNDVTIIE